MWPTLIPLTLIYEHSGLSHSDSCFQHQEKNGLLFWKRWVNVSENENNLGAPFPLALEQNDTTLYLHYCISKKVEVTSKNIYFSTITAGICTNCTGLLASFKACCRFKIWPRITLICLSKWCRSKPLSCYGNRRAIKCAIITRAMSKTLVFIE